MAEHLMYTYTTETELSPATLNLQADVVTALWADLMPLCKVANIAGRRAALVIFTQKFGVPNSLRPLAVWRADAPAGKWLEFTADGETWLYLQTADTLHVQDLFNVSDTDPVEGDKLIYNSATDEWEITQ